MLLKVSLKFKWEIIMVLNFVHVFVCHMWFLNLLTFLQKKPTKTYIKYYIGYVGIKWYEYFSALLELAWLEVNNRPCVGFLLQTHQKTTAATSVQKMMKPTNPPKIANPIALSSVEKQRGVRIENLIFFGVYTKKTLFFSI